MKPLILFYSYSGNTRKIAETIGKVTGGVLSEIIPVAPYPADYDECVDQAEIEVKNGFKPDIEPMKASIAEYDTIYIGTPVWWYTFAPPIRTVITENTWDGKIVYPFATHGGGLGATFPDVRKYCLGATVKDGFDVFFSGTSGSKGETEITKWIRGN